MAVVDYDTEDLGPPILTVEEAVEKSSFYEVPPFFYPEHVGDFSKGMAAADHKILSAEVLNKFVLLFPFDFTMFFAVGPHSNAKLILFRCI